MWSPAESQVTMRLVRRKKRLQSNLLAGINATVVVLPQTLNFSYLRYDGHILPVLFQGSKAHP
jgi:hypothetical protein